MTWALPFFILTFSMNFPVTSLTVQKQPSRGVLMKRCSENMQQIYKKTPMPKCDFNKVACNFIEIALRHGYLPVNLLYIIRTLFHQNTSGRLLLTVGPRPTIFWHYIFNLFMKLNDVNKTCLNLSNLIKLINWSIKLINLIKLVTVSLHLVFKKIHQNRKGYFH